MKVPGFLVKAVQISMIVGTLSGAAVAANNLLLQREPSGPIEPGAVAQKQLSIYSVKNERGNLESFLQYDNGGTKISKPIFDGPYGPVVGDAAYNWKSFEPEIRYQFSEQGFEELPSTRQGAILEREMISTIRQQYGMETNGGVQNGFVQKSSGSNK